MTLRGVIQDLLRGSDDAEAMLAEDGYGDLPPEMFGQALSSYADTAPMAEADALSPILTSIDQGDASDVFAILEEQPPVVADSGGGADAGALAASLLGADTVSDITDGIGDDLADDAAFDDFGTAAPDEGDIDDELSEDAGSIEIDALDDLATDDLADDVDDPFGEPEALLDNAPVDSAGEFEELEDFFDTEPVATGDDPSDLDF